MKRLLFALLLVSGCAQLQQSPEVAIVRESMYQGVRTQRQFSKDVAAKLVIDPSTGKDHREELTPLSQAQYDNLLKADQEFENTYNKYKVGGE